MSGAGELTLWQGAERPVEEMALEYLTASCPYLRGSHQEDKARLLSAKHGRMTEGHGWKTETFSTNIKKKKKNQKKTRTFKKVALGGFHDLISKVLNHLVSSSWLALLRGSRICIRNLLTFFLTCTLLRPYEFSAIYSSVFCQQFWKCNSLACHSASDIVIFGKKSIKARKLLMLFNTTLVEWSYADNEFPEN